MRSSVLRGAVLTKKSAVHAKNGSRKKYGFYGEEERPALLLGVNSAPEDATPLGQSSTVDHFYRRYGMKRNPYQQS